jgi:hypothetical protein
VVWLLAPPYPIVLKEKGNVETLLWDELLTCVSSISKVVQMVGIRPI